MGVFLGVGYGQANLLVNATGTSWNQIATMGFKDTAGTGNANAAATAWLGYWTTSSSNPFNAANVSSQYSVVRCDTVIMTASGPIIGTAGSPLVGSATINPPPPNCAILVQKSTARGGRRGRGRLFLSPCLVDEGNVGPSGTIAAGTLSTLQTRVTQVLTSASGGNYPAYLLHDFSEVAPDAITALTVQARMATQRKRMRK